mgnify:CR=1 FL=1
MKILLFYFKKNILIIIYIFEKIINFGFYVSYQNFLDTINDIKIVIYQSNLDRLYLSNTAIQS